MKKSIRGIKLEKKATERKTKIKEKEVTYLKDPIVSFVSLVKHPANGQPFLMMKDAKGIRKVIQRVIVAKDLPEEVQKKVTEGIDLTHATEYDNHFAYDQIEKSACNPDSFSGVELDESGKVVAVLAELKKDEEIPAETEIKKEDSSWKGYETKWKIYDEIYALEKVCLGIIEQSAADENWQKKTLTTAAKNFVSFVKSLTSGDAEMMKEVGETLSKIHEMRKSVEAPAETENKSEPASDSELSKAVSVMSGILEKLNKEDKSMELFKTKEEVEEFVKSVIQAHEDAKAKSTEEAAKSADLEKAAKEKKEFIENLRKDVDAIKGEIDTLKGTTQESAAVGDPPLKKEAVEKRIWSGILG